MINLSLVIEIHFLNVGHQAEHAPIERQSLALWMNPS